MPMILKKPLFIAKQWEFKHTTRSPLYPQANKLMEKSVQTVKNLLIKANHDPISDYRGIVTPIDDVASPAQLLMSRRLRSIIPTTEAQLLPEVLDPQKIMETLKQKYYFDQHIPHLPGLAEVDPGQRTQGKLVGNNGGKNCRNRKMLMKLS